MRFSRAFVLGFAAQRALAQTLQAPTGDGLTVVATADDSEPNTGDVPVTQPDTRAEPEEPTGDSREPGSEVPAPQESGTPDEPVDEPTDEPVDEPTDEPSDEPTEEPTDEPDTTPNEPASPSDDSAEVTAPAEESDSPDTPSEGPVTEDEPAASITDAPNDTKETGADAERTSAPDSPGATQTDEDAPETTADDDDEDDDSESTADADGSRTTDKDDDSKSTADSTSDSSATPTSTPEVVSLDLTNATVGENAEFVQVEGKTAIRLSPPANGKATLNIDIEEPIDISPGSLVRVVASITVGGANKRRSLRTRQQLGDCTFKMSVDGTNVYNKALSAAKGDLQQVTSNTFEASENPQIEMVQECGDKPTPLTLNNAVIAEERRRGGSGSGGGDGGDGGSEGGDGSSDGGSNGGSGSGSGSDSDSDSDSGSGSGSGDDGDSERNDAGSLSLHKAAVCLVPFIAGLVAVV